MPTPQNEAQTTELLKSALAMLAMEREQCAALVESMAENYAHSSGHEYSVLLAAAEAIRARGNP